MHSILGNEILKTYFKRRSWIAFAAIGVVTPLVQIAFKVQDDSMIRSLTRGIGGDFILVGNLLNGYFVTFILMNGLWIHIPFLIALAVGDQLAGEATGGTFRILLIRPVSRSSILVAKYSTTLLYTLSVVLFLGILSLGLGLALFGTGPLVVIGRAFIVIPESEVAWRLALAFALALWGMWTVASLAFLFSSLVENAIGPIIGTMAVMIVFYVVSNMSLDLFRAVQPYLFTSHMNVWQKVMESPIPWSSVGTSVAVLGSYSLCFFVCAWYIFARKDILS